MINIFLKLSYSLIGTDVDNTERLETEGGPEDPLTCCKKHGVSENCLGLCTKVESRGLSNQTTFTSACDQHKLSIMRCIVASFEDKPMNGYFYDYYDYFFNYNSIL